MVYDGTDELLCDAVLPDVLPTADTVAASFPAAASADNGLPAAIAAHSAHITMLLIPVRFMFVTNPFPGRSVPFQPPKPAQTIDFDIFLKNL